MVAPIGAASHRLVNGYQPAQPRPQARTTSWSDVLKSLVTDSKTPYSEMEAIKVATVANQHGPEVKRLKILGHHWNMPANQQVERKADGSVVVKGQFSHDWKYDINEPVSYTMTYRNGRLVSEDIKVFTSKLIGHSSWKPIQHGVFGGGWREVAKKLSRALGAAGYLGTSTEPMNVDRREAAIKDGVRGAQIRHETEVTIDGGQWRFRKADVRVCDAGIFVSGKIYRQHFGATDDEILYTAVLKDGRLGFTDFNVLASVQAPRLSHRSATFSDLDGFRHQDALAALKPFGKELASRVCLGIFDNMQQHARIPSYGIRV